MSAPLIAIVGPDGTGKSTLVANVKASLEHSGMRVNHLHFDPRSRPGDPRAVTEPHEIPPRSLSASLSTITVRALRFARAQRLGGALARHGIDYVIQERGWLDQWVDPRRYRMHPRSAGFARLLAPVVARYDGVIICAGDAARIHARKPEIGEVEIARQLDAWRAITAAHPHVLTLDTVNLRPDECAVAALAFVRSIRSHVTTTQLRPVAFQPRRLEMIASKGARTATAVLYRPHSSMGRIRKLLRVRQPSGRQVATVEHVARLLAQFDLRFDALAAIRSVGRDQAVLALVVDGAVRSFVKLTWGSGSLSQEAAMLAALQQEPLAGVQTPQLLQVMDGNDVHAIEMTAVAGSTRNNHDPRLVVATAATLAHALGGRGVTHGDFAPWNLVSGSAAGLVDWEHSSFDCERGRDLAHYLVTSGTSDDAALTARYVDAYVDAVGDDQPGKLADSIHTMVEQARRGDA